MTTVDWTRAACRDADPDLFHHDTAYSKKLALDICATCNIRTACRTWAHSQGGWEQTVVGGEYWTKLGRPESPHSTHHAARAGYLSVREAARRIGMTDDGIKKAAAIGRIPATRDENGRYWFRAAHVDAYQPHQNHGKAAA